jgi:D-alanyl-D-alanine carboxypeptidase
MAPIPDRQPTAPVAAAPAVKLHDIVPKPKPVIAVAVAKAETPKHDPIAALIAAEQKKPVGVDGASFVPSGRLASILPAPNPLRIAAKAIKASYTPAEDESVADSARRWAVQIGAYADRATALVHLTKYAERSMDVLGQAKRLVVPSPGTSGKTLYRARFGLFGENEARAVCRRMTSRGETCFAVLQGAG